MANIAARLDRVLRAAGLAIVGVSIGDEANRATWTVFPADLQTAAQAYIDAFDPNDPALTEAEDRAAATAIMARNERFISAIIWTVIDAYSPPATREKHQAALARLIDAYRTKPWLA